MKNPPKELWVVFSSDGSFIARGRQGWASDLGDGWTKPVRYIRQRKPKAKIKDMNGVKLVPKKHNEEEEE